MFLVLLPLWLLVCREGAGFFFVFFTNTRGDRLGKPLMIIVKAPGGQPTTSKGTMLAL